MSRIAALVLVILILPRSVFGLELSLPVLYDGGVSERTEGQRQASYIVYDVVKDAGENVYRLHSLTNLGSGDVWYAFSKSMILYGVDVSQPAILGTWPLTRWGGELADKELGTLFWDRYLDDRDWGGLSADGHLWEGTLGCLDQAPLRYGQVGGAPNPQLVLLLRGEQDYLDFVIFSPDHAEVVFSTRLALQDAYDAAGDNVSIAPWQYQGYAFETVSTYPAVRLYSKLFVADFDDDGAQDIVQWRKQYASRRKGETPPGYKLENEVLRLYKVEEGRYATQDIDSLAIKGMLAAQSLTWQSGFPTYSECPGQEGQLIPEMHDPLLNDPDVLQ